MERMTEADQTMLLLFLQREMVEMRRKAEEAAQKNEQELQVLRRENEEMKKKLGGEDPPSYRRMLSASHPSPQPRCSRGDERSTPSSRNRDGRRVVPNQVHPDDPDGQPEPPTPLYQHHHRSPTA